MLEASSKTRGEWSHHAPRRLALCPKSSAWDLSVYVSIVAGEHSEAWLKHFIESVAEMPQVVEFYRTAGDVDYMLRIVVADMSAFDDFYKRLIAIAPLRKVVSRFAMERIKSTTRAPFSDAFH